MATTITLESLTKRFDGAPGAKGGGATVAVDSVSLTIDAGELFFLLGPSGCGKTTLLRMVAGFIDPTSGRILFDTGAGVRDVTHLPPNKRNTGMVFQSYALWPHMTVAANVAFGLTIRKVSAEEKQRRVREALAAVQMEQYADRRPNQLSGGQQQRVALARALVIRPDVLLLDEPLSNLDAKLRNELRSEIRRICKEARGVAADGAGGGSGITAIYVTHDQKEALSMADRVAIVNRGRIEQLGPPGELYRRPRTRFVAEFLGETNILPGTLLERGGAAGPGLALVRTAAGEFVSAVLSPDLAAQTTDVAVSIRPEAWRLENSAGRNTLPGRVAEATYLGETEQLVVELPGGARVKVAHLNPGASARTGEAVTVSAAPADVVVLPS
ncbi:MAG: ABC transporter ATP-binding protein [Phycisphaeraceae bacterium]|nr:ABC transporter ATP-binding protein [Phycisphaeraceae bacterium]